MASKEASKWGEYMANILLTLGDVYDQIAVLHEDISILLQFSQAKADSSSSTIL